MRSSKLAVIGTAISLAAVLAVAGCDRTSDTASKDTLDNSTASGNTSDTMKDNLQEGTTDAKGAVSDAAITTKVKSAILADANLNVLDIHVDTVNGVVTLTGTVDSSQNVNHAATVAGSIDGVKSVNNKLQIKSAG